MILTVLMHGAFLLVQSKQNYKMYNMDRNAFKIMCQLIWMTLLN